MAYEKQNFVDGKPLSAAQMNHIEEGIENLEEAVPTVPSALPNPNPLTITVGDGTGRYTGAEPLDLTPFVEAMINGMLESVRWYGAAGDGQTDDTAAFEAALAGSRRVFVPGGTYILSGELTIRDNCGLELAQDAVLKFTQTSGNCISMKMSASLRGNHATVTVPYEFSGNVVNVASPLNDDVSSVPPWTRWTPSWKAGRYLTDLNIVKPDSRGFHYSLDGTCTGTAVYISADGGAVSTFIWGLNFSGLRIAGGFKYGVRAENFNEGWNHEMRIGAFIDGCEIGVSLQDCNNAYISAAVQPRRAYSLEEVYTPYAKHGIELIRSRNTDLSGARVWDWNSQNSLWTADNMYQHISMIGDCGGTILNDFFYYEMPNYDIRDLIYTDTPGNLEKITILQEPFTRWFKRIGTGPYFFDGDTEKRLVLKEEFDECFQTDYVPQFTDVLSAAGDGSGGVFNGIGYKVGGYWETDGKTLVESDYHFCTGYIPVRQGQTLYAHGMSFAEGDDFCRVVTYDSGFNKLNHVNRGNLIGNASYFVGYTETDNGFQMPVKNPDTVAYVTISARKSTLSANPAIAVDEEIAFAQAGFLSDGVKVKVENVAGLDEVLGSYISDVDALIGGGS